MSEDDLFLAFILAVVAGGQSHPDKAGEVAMRYFNAYKRAKEKLDEKHG